MADLWQDVCVKEGTVFTLDLVDFVLFRVISFLVFMISIVLITSTEQQIVILLYRRGHEPHVRALVAAWSVATRIVCLTAAVFSIVGAVLIAWGVYLDWRDTQHKGGEP